MTNVDEGDKEDLKFKLMEDFKNIVSRFAYVIEETQTSLIAREVNLTRLVNRILTLNVYISAVHQKPLLNEEKKELINCKTICDIFTIIIPYMSFFNFEVLKHITDSSQLCSDDDRKRMEEYCRHFEQFCRRKVFEVPCDALGLSTSRVTKYKRKVFAVVITEYDEAPTLQFLKRGREKIASLLNLKFSSLYLHRIDLGSLIIVLSIPMFLAKDLFPLQSSIRAALKAEGLYIYYSTEDTQKGIGLHYVMSLC